MERVRRSHYVFFHFSDEKLLDIPRLFDGVIETTPITQISAVSILRRAVYAISPEELEVLRAIHTEEWTLVCELYEKFPDLTLATLKNLAAQGLILSDGSEDSSTLLNSRHDELSSSQWNTYAALYHFMSRWQDVDVKIDIDFCDDPETPAEIEIPAKETLDEFVKRHGNPPPHFQPAERSRGIRRLPVATRSHGLYDVLLARETRRAFDSTKCLAEDDLAAILHYVFGCHGLVQLNDKFSVLKKTSPSGGAMHPIEVYPLILQVEGWAPGLYHYNVERHALETIELVELEQARQLANEFTAGQSYPSRAHVLFIMTARFFRNFWKYRRHQLAYSVVLLDAAHLSQSCYLVCTELGLAAFFTAAINTVNIEERLGLNGYKEGVIAICGCGVRAPYRIALDPQFGPYARPAEHTDEISPLEV